MDYQNQRAQLLAHCLWMMSLDPAYAKWASEKYAKLPHLQGLHLDVQSEWLRLNPPPSPTPRPPKRSP